MNDTVNTTQMSGSSLVSQPTEQQLKRLANILWLISGVVFILSLLAIIIKIYLSAEIATLRYNIIIGVTQIGNRYDLLKLPLAGLLISLANFILAKFNRSNQKIIPLLASIVTVGLNLILLFAALLLFQVN
jgi:hypothetical protein